MDQENFLEYCTAVGLKIEPGVLSKQWLKVLNESHYQPVSYIPSFVNYQLKYYSERVADCCDFSCVIFFEGESVALWLLTLAGIGGFYSITSQGREVLPLLFSSQLPSRSRKKITQRVLKVIAGISTEFRISKILSSAVFDESMELNYVHRLLMERGAFSSVKHHLYVDLSPKVEIIRSKFRDSYKSLISRAESMWSVEIHSENVTDEIWNEFRLLHRNVSRRETRSHGTWLLQLNSLRASEAFLVTLRDRHSKLVGGGYFVCSRDEGVYAVGVYDRNLFQFPLGHLVQYEAINEFKRRKCRWYFIGRRFYPGEQPLPSDKEQSISHFKEGFASHSFPVLSFIENLIYKD